MTKPTDFLTRGRCVIVGLGGIGSILSRYAAVFLNSLGPRIKYVLVDGDSFEPRNAERMLLKPYQLFGNKAFAMLNDMHDMFPNLEITCLPQYVTNEHVKTAVQDGDCVLACVDNHRTRSILSARCGDLNNVVLISGGNDGVEGDLTGSSGNVLIYIRENGQDVTTPFEKWHDEIANPTDELPAAARAGGCDRDTAHTPQLLPANFQVAAVMLNTLLRLVKHGTESIMDEVHFDVIDAMMAPVCYRMPAPAAPLEQQVVEG